VGGGGEICPPLAHRTRRTGGETKGMAEAGCLRLLATEDEPLSGRSSVTLPSAIVVVATMTTVDAVTTVASVVRRCLQAAGRIAPTHSRRRGARGVTVRSVASRRPRRSSIAVISRGRGGATSPRSILPRPSLCSGRMVVQEEAGGEEERRRPCTCWHLTHIRTGGRLQAPGPTRTRCAGRWVGGGTGVRK